MTYILKPPKLHHGILDYFKVMRDILVGYIQFVIGLTE